ncbi:MAG TPA: endonuclease III domain-containing protein [Thermoguttaceae bacterium]|nr:endonuclease III domain-containing protein [Thermoguttaceae bacterium]
MSQPLQEVYRRLFDAYGPQHWWPGQSPFEVVVGAVLVQNTNWKNVEQAIANLRDADLLSPRALFDTPVEELAELIRPAGYYRIKARRLSNLVRMIVEEYDGDLDAMFAAGAATLREKLLEVNGVGPETADSILLYAGNLPVFVIDGYTYRVMTRHGWIEPEIDYHGLQEHFETHLPQDVVLYNEFHALLVRVGHLHCRKTPKCDGCPLAEMLPEGGIVQPEW